MTPKEKYLEALKDLLNAQEAIQQEDDNPFNLGLPAQLGLPEETFISNAELEELKTIMEEASTDNLKFAKLWNLSTDFTLSAKAILL